MEGDLQERVTQAVDVSPAESDESLLAQFVRRRDERAFLLLVERHGPLVMGVCRRVLADVHDADDAFQATFLVLACRAARIRRRASLSAWLYGVAFRTARRLVARRKKYTTVSLPEELARESDPLAELAIRHDAKVLDEELNRLPAKYRDPLVMHYLLGMPQRDVARELGETTTAIDGRMKRARRRLRIRLAARGVTVTGLSLAAVLESSRAAVAPALIESTVEGAVALVQGVSPAVASGSSVAGGSNVIQLANQELAMMTLLGASKTTAGVTLAGCALLVLTMVGIAASNPPPGAANAPQRIELAQAGPSSSGSESAQVVQPPIAGPPAAAPDAGAADISGIAPPGGIGGDPFSGGLGAASTTPRSTWSAQVVSDELKRWQATDYKTRQAAEERIYAELDKDTTVEFIETPLADIVHFLRDLHGFPIVLDTAALDAAGIGTDEPITLSLTGVSLRSMLRLMLRPLGLDYVIRDEVMQITSIEAAEGMLETRVYELRHLPTIEPETLVEIIQTTIRPESWSNLYSPVAAGPDGGASSSVRANIAAIASGALVVTQSQRGHEEIVDLLEQLSHFAENPLYRPAPVGAPPR
jgi:RNA polymerase sigma factor (sigma-70 family)